MHDIEVRLKQILKDHLGVDPVQVQPDSRFAADLGADSLDSVEICMAIEDEFSVTFGRGEMATIRTYRDAVRFVRRELGAAPASLAE